MKSTAAAVLLALRDLPAERAASMPHDQVGRKGTAPNRTELAKRAGVAAGDLDELVEQLKADGLVTVITSATSDQRVHAVSIRGHEWLADHAEVAC